MIICLIQAVVGWFVLMLVATNLIGFVVRGLVEQPVTAGADAPDFLQEEVAKANRMSTGVTLFFALVTVLYLYLLFHFWNVGVIVAAAMLMLSRLPDLLWELRTGRKITSSDAPRGVIAVLSTCLMWGAFPVLWFALCYGV
jgi:hypothetical protein